MPHSIKLHNTLSGRKEIFTPKTNHHVNLYCCGPTVYDYAHIGNFRSFLMADLLSRVLSYAGYGVTKVQNITDVGHLTNDDLADANGDDKIAKKAKLEGKTAWDIAEYYTQAFIADEKTLRITPPDHRPRATDYVAEQIELIKTLINKGFAYEVNGSVYFQTAKFKNYGALSKNKLADLQAGARVEINDEKKDPLDFALWKHAGAEHLMQWDFNTGEKLEAGLDKSSPLQRPVSVSPGFPGWHIECSAMSQKLLPHTDIHTGGEDNTFPHHECEIAQNECSHHYHIPMWLHAKHLLVDGKKMSKSAGNFFTIRDLLDKGYKGEEIRYALLAAHYRTALNFTESSLIAAQGAIQTITKFYKVRTTTQREIEEDNFAEPFRKNFRTALFDDLNVSKALSSTFDLISTANKKISEDGLPQASVQSVLNFIENDFNFIFDVINHLEPDFEIPIEVKTLIEKRKQAKETKDWESADAIRDKIRANGFEIIDIGKEGHSIIRPL